jgi:chromosome condensin MukBEF complex kleisin-like MukF subunit
VRNFIEVVNRMIATLPAGGGFWSGSARDDLRAALDRIGPFVAPELYWESYAGWIDRVLASYAPNVNDIPSWLQPAIDIWTGKADK